MGLLDFTSRVVTEYRADVSDHREKVRQLTGDQKQLAQAELDAAKARNKQLEDWKDGLTKIGLAVGAVYAAYEIGANSLQTWAQYQKEATASAKFDIDALSDAAGGLQDRLELMTFAAETSQGVFKLSQEQMELVEQGIRAYTKAGFDAQEVTQGFTDALISGRTRGLKQFGIDISDTSDRTKEFGEIQDAISAKLKEQGGDLDVAGDNVRRLGVHWSNFKDDVKIGIADGIMGAVDGITSGLHAMREGLREDIDGVIHLSESLMGLTPAIQDAYREMGKYVAVEKEKINVENADITTMLVLKQMGALTGADISRLLKTEDAQKTALEAAAAMSGATSSAAATLAEATKKRHPTRRGAAGEGPAWRDVTTSDEDWSDLATPGYGEATPSIGYSAYGNALGFDTSAIEKIQASRDEMASRESRYSAWSAKQGASWAEQHFGKLDEFHAYATAFDTLAKASGAAFEAWIDGSESLGDAIKKTIASSVAAVGSQMLVESLKEGAYALASLAFGDFAGAAAHGEAAAAFAAGALIAGGVARELGGTVATATGAANSNAPSLVGAGTTPSTQPNNLTVILGDEFASDTAFRRQQRASNAINQAKRRSGDGAGVVWA